MAILLRVGDSETHVTGSRSTTVYHGRALHGVTGAVSEGVPCVAVERGVYTILIEEGGIFELCP